ncbi:MAG: hypothetical protein CVV49_00065 [Spirochaetae bacterium HGW-Spirochaetae-5]|nr:MAG: hypothetical protein CVV49_00065 [Spirochaetae bacterium HGW-Spirochaetae-5]
MSFIKRNIKALIGAFLGVAYVVILICIFLSIGCGTIQKDFSPDKEVIKDLKQVIKSGVLSVVPGDSDDVKFKKSAALDAVNKSLLTIKSRAEPEKESSLDKIFNIGVLIIIIIVLLFIYKVFKSVGG